MCVHVCMCAFRCVCVCVYVCACLLTVPKLQSLKRAERPYTLPNRKSPNIFLSLYRTKKRSNRYTMCMELLYEVCKMWTSSKFQCSSVSNVRSWLELTKLFHCLSCQMNQHTSLRDCNLCKPQHLFLLRSL